MTINATRLGIIEQWLGKTGLTSSLMFFTDPECGTKTGKIYDLGTTRLPAMGDFNISGGTTINSTGVNGRPAWVNANSIAQGYWGNRRYNQIRRKRQITFAVLYERTQTSADITLIGTGPVWGATFDGNEILAVRHTSGTPGTVQFILSDDTSGAVTATVTAAASSGPLVAICTYDGTDMVAYSGISGSTISAGTANSSLDPNPNWGQNTTHFTESGNNAGIIRSALAGARQIVGTGTHPYTINVGGFGDKAVVPVLGSGSQHIYNFVGASSGPSMWPESIQFNEAEAQFKAASVLILETGIDSDTVDDLRKVLFAVPGTVTKNLIDDYGAVADGGSGSPTDDAAKFLAFAVDALADFGHDQALTLTSGRNFRANGGAQFWTTNGTGVGSGAIRKLTVNATGATVSTANSSQIFDFGGGLVGNLWSTENALIATVDAGADRVTLLTRSEASRFVIGDYVMVAGLLVQPDGDPPNFYYCEYVKIVGMASDTVMFDRRLRNTYKSTWPAWGGKSAGPACIVRCVNWDSDITYNGGTFTQAAGGHTRSRKLTFNGSTFDPSFTATNSDIIHVIGNGGTSSTFAEVDKLISVLLFQNGSSGMAVDHQSANPGLTVFDNYELTDTVNGLQGTPKHCWIRNGSHIAHLKPGSFYGTIKSLTVEDSQVDVWELGNASQDYGGPGTQVGVDNVYTITDGTICIPGDSLPTIGGLCIYIPGNVLFFSSDYPYTFQQSFKVLDVRTDGTDFFIDTTLTLDAFPTPVGGGLLGIISHPCPRMTCSDVFYADGVTHPSWDTAVGATAGAALGTYGRSYYTQANLVFGSPAGLPYIMGRVQQLRFYVTAANAGGPTAQMMNLQYIKADGTTANYNPKIDLSTPGERIIVPGVTSTVVSLSDSALNLPAGAWFPGAAFSGPAPDSSITGTVGLTITMQTDQEATADPDSDELPLYAMAMAQLGLTSNGTASPPPDTPPPVNNRRYKYVAFQG